MNKISMVDLVKEMLKEADITLDIDKGDLLLGGKFKNKPVVVEEFGTDSLGQPTVNGRTLLTHRINKTLPEDKKKKEAGLRQILMDKIFGQEQTDKPVDTDKSDTKKALEALMRIIYNQAN